MPTILKRILPWLRACLGMSLLVFVLFWVDWSQALGYLRTADLRWILPGVVCVLFLLAIKTIRSGLLLYQVGVRLRARQIIEIYLGGQALNILLPLRGGELVRLGMLGTAQPGHVPESASSIVAEKVLDALALGLLVSLLFFTLPPDLAGKTLGPLLPRLGVLMIFILLLMLLSFILWPRIYAVMQRIFSGLLLHIFERVNETMLRWRQISRRPRSLLPVVMLTAANWLVMWGVNWIHFRALGIPLGGAAAAVVLALLMVGLLPALSPGNIGPFHFFAALGLRPFGVPVEQGIAYAIVLHAVVTLPPLLLGGVFLLLPGGHSPLKEIPHA